MRSSKPHPLGLPGRPHAQATTAPNLLSYANVNGKSAGRLDERETRWQRRQIEAAMLREGKISKKSMNQPLAPPYAGSGEDRPLLQLDGPAIVFGGPYG